MQSQALTARAIISVLTSAPVADSPWWPTDRVPCPIVNKCNSCKEYKCISEFYLLKPSNVKGRLLTLGKKVGICCKVCASRQYKNSSTESKILNSCRKRAKEKGLEFSLKLEDIVIPSHCPMLGIPLFPTSGQAAHANSPSLDRIDPKKGYTPENTIIISHRANTIKSNATPEELRLIADCTERLIMERSALRAA